MSLTHPQPLTIRAPRCTPAPSLRSPTQDSGPRTQDPPFPSSTQDFPLRTQDFPPPSSDFPLPTSAFSFNPSPDLTSQILTDFNNPHRTIQDIAEEHWTTVDALALWLTRPDIAQLRRACRTIISERVCEIAANYLPNVARILNSILTDHEHEVTHAQFNPNKLRSLEHRQRSRETARKAAALLHRLTRFDLNAPPPPRGRGQGEGFAAHATSAPTPPIARGLESPLTTTASAPPPSLEQWERFAALPTTALTTERFEDHTPSLSTSHAPIPVAMAPPATPPTAIPTRTLQHHLRDLATKSPTPERAPTLAPSTTSHIPPAPAPNSGLSTQDSALPPQDSILSPLSPPDPRTQDSFFSSS